MQQFERSDYIKVEITGPDEPIGEWIWVRVDYCDYQRELVFGSLDNEPLNEYGGDISLGSRLAVSFDRIREHRKPTEFRQQ